MLKPLFRSVRCFALLAALPLASYSDVVYAFLGAIRNDNNSGRTVDSFVLIVPDYLKFATPNQFLDFQCSHLSSSFNCTSGVSFNSNGASFVFYNNQGYLFPGDVFSAPGAYLTQFYGEPQTDSGSLQVQVVSSASESDPTKVPEPKTVWLLLTATAAALFLRRVGLQNT